MGFFSEYRTANKILQQKYPVIIYAESRHYYQYFKQLAEAYFHQSGLPLLYITSDKDDPLLHIKHERLQAIYVKRFLGFLFSRLKANVVIMTMADLDNYLFKRSPQAGCYVYIFHAAVSIHQQYREKAFFHYDAFFATGKHHSLELEKLEKIYGLPHKEVIPYGYPLLDVINKKYESVKERKVAGARLKVLIAPSWYEQCLLETCMNELVEQLSLLTVEVIIRSHPEYVKRSPQKYAALKKLTGTLTNIAFDENPDVKDSLAAADMLITDRSGIALEYAFGTLRPVLFIDTPSKIMNPQWQKLQLEPVEDALRSEIGVRISPEEISRVKEKMEELTKMQEHYRNKLQQLKAALFYNSGESYKAGLNYILTKAGNS